jgi:hypothetical protein
LSESATSFSVAGDWYLIIDVLARYGYNVLHAK